MKTPSLYQRLVDAGVQIESHYSDLHFPVTEASNIILAEYAADWTEEFGMTYNIPWMCPTFLNKVEGGLWRSAAGAYEPFWGASKKEVAISNETRDKG